MPQSELIFFMDGDRRCPFLEWFDTLDDRAQDKCRVRLERLSLLGHELRRPEADFLRDGIYELRFGLRGINYRVLYFFHGRNVVVVSHGLMKERSVPSREIDLALARKARFSQSPARHTYTEELS